MKADWFLPCAFAQSDLTRTAYHLMQRNLKLPHSDKFEPIQLCQLTELGEIGRDRRDIYDGFELTTSKTIYPAFWGHDADTILSMAQEPNRYLSPLPQARAGRKLRKVTDLWPFAGTILLAERMRLNTQRLVAVRLTEPVLSNVWWSFVIDKKLNQSHVDKALVLWLNSTLGQIILLTIRDETEGAWVDFKKPSLGAMPVLDVRRLTPQQLTQLVATYDKVCDKEIMPLPQMEKDQIRYQIDAAIAQALNLPDFSVLRTMLAREPVVCMKRI
jgi:hypothetical protein